MHKYRENSASKIYKSNYGTLTKTSAETAFGTLISIYYCYSKFELYIMPDTSTTSLSIELLDIVKVYESDTHVQFMKLRVDNVIECFLILTTDK